MDGNLKLKKSNKEGKDEEFPYQSLIGAILYLSVSTRPDIAYAVSVLSQFNANYTQEHWIAAKSILGYLRRTSGYELVHRKTGKKLERFIDADWTSCTNDRRSYTGYVLLLGGGSILSRTSF